MSEQVSMRAIPGIPPIHAGDDLGHILVDALFRAALILDDGDILVVAQKVLSKAAGCFVRLADITPSQEAIGLAERLHKDPRKVEVILRESRRVVRAVKHPHRDEGVLITEHRLGFVCANAAIDESNVGEPDTVLLLPTDPDDSARRLQKTVMALTDANVGVIITDTFGRPWRLGLVNVAIGLAGVPALLDLAGQADAYGRPLSVTTPAIADEIAAASGLIMAKSAMTPAAVFKGVHWAARPDTSAQDILRPPQEDLFA